MVIHISEPGRPGNIPLTPPASRRSQPIPDGPDATAKTSVTPEDETYIADGQSHRAVEAYGEQSEGVPDDQASYIPLSALTSEPLYLIEDEESLQSALNQMNAEQTDYLTVINDDTILGIISRRWVFELIAEQGSAESPLKEAKLPSFLYATTESDARMLARRMLANGHQSALLLDARQAPVGLITQRSFLRHYAAQRPLDELG